MESMNSDLKEKESIKRNFSNLFLQRTPKNLKVKIDVVDFNPAPKVLRIKVLADFNGNRLVYDETLIEEVVSE